MNPINTNNTMKWDYDTLSYNYAEREYRLLKEKMIRDRMKLPMTLAEQRLYDKELRDICSYIEHYDRQEYEEDKHKKRHQVKFQYTLFELNQQACTI